MSRPGAGVRANGNTHMPSAGQALSLSQLSDQGSRLVLRRRQCHRHRRLGFERRLLVAQLGLQLLRLRVDEIRRCHVHAGSMIMRVHLQTILVVGSGSKRFAVQRTAVDPKRCARAVRQVPCAPGPSIEWRAFEILMLCPLHAVSG